MKKKTLDEKAAEKLYPEGTVHDAIMKAAFLIGVKYGRRTAIETVTQECHRNNTKIDYCYCIEATAAIKARSRK